MGLSRAMGWVALPWFVAWAMAACDGDDAPSQPGVGGGSSPADAGGGAPPDGSSPDGMPSDGDAASAGDCGSLPDGAPCPDGVCVDGNCEPPSDRPLSAVPGVDGFGVDTRHAYAGNGAPDICVVDRLAADADGPHDGETRSGVPVRVGSLRGCLDYVTSDGQGKIVLFEVSGTIMALSGNLLRIRHGRGNVFIAGQTAPSPGITVRGQGLGIRASNVVVQHMAWRTGCDLELAGDADTLDAIEIGATDEPTYGVVIDHCSLSWSLDGLFGVATYDAGMHVDGVTLSSSILSEALASDPNHAFCNSHYPNGRALHSEGDADGAHSTAVLLHTNARRVSLIGNLWANNRHRNPFVNASTPGMEMVLVNNVIYGARDVASSVGQSGSVPTMSVVGNHYIDRPAGQPNYGFRIYVAATSHFDDNIFRGQAYPWGPSFENQVYEPFVRDRDCYCNVNEPTPPTWPTGLTALSSTDVLDHVLSHAGSRPADRDPVDAAVAVSVLDGSGAIINCPEESVSGGWADLAENARRVDDMPAEMAGIPIGDLPADPHGDHDGDGYTDIEEWLHRLAFALRSTP